MQKTLFAWSACLALLLADPALAHGGIYRGPRDVVPPGGYGPGGRPTPGRGPTTPGGGPHVNPGPNSPSTPNGAGPRTPGGSPFGPGGSPRTPGGGVQLADDLSRWVYWWEFNKDSYLRLKDALFADAPVSGGDEVYFGGGRRVRGRDTLRPGESDVLGTVVPALHRSLDATDDRDITSSCLVALAKIGKQRDGESLRDVFRARLTSASQEIRETAALAMGISGRPEMIEDLQALVRDDRAGRALCGRSEVDDRTRSFAAYGLGLIAYRTNALPLKRQVFGTLRAILADDALPSLNLPVAAINGLRLLRPDGSGPGHVALAAETVAALMTFYRRDLGRGAELVQAHVPPAVARLVGRDGAGTGALRAEFVERLGGRQRRANANYQSLVLALGALGQSRDDGDDASRALLAFWRDGRDAQARYFALISLAQIGGNANRTALLKILRRAKHLERPWAALALGVWAFRHLEAEGDPGVVQTIGEALRRELAEVRDPDSRAAIAVALGLCRYREAADDLSALLIRYKHQDESAGYLCLGLALMNATTAVDDIRELVKSSVRRPERLLQSAVALGKLGDRSAATLLEDLLKDPNRNVARLAAIAKALGTIGDRRSLDPLRRVLFDPSLTELSRAFAAVALGSICDKEDVPWSAKISRDLNYRAAVPTLVNQASGVLDIL